MDGITELSESIEDEIEDAKKYAKAAEHYKESDPDLAEMYYALSLEETKHMQMLHDWAVKKIQSIQQKYRA